MRWLLLISALWLVCSRDSDEAGDRSRSRDHIDQILLGELPVHHSKHPFRQSEQAALRHLRDIYHAKIRPVENLFRYSDLKRHVLTDADIYAKPIVLLVGPWSTGKSTIINYILGVEQSMQALHVGAEPTTADFTVITYGEEYRTVEGLVLATDLTKPFSSMEKFGQIFLEHLLGIEMPKPLLKNITFIDTPGILENRRQQERGYPYNDVLRWLVQRADLIFVVFDPTKLDVGTELESLFLQLKGKESVLRIILNKADSMTEQELMRVYGALFWSLAPLINVTEPPRIYVGSFWSQNFQTSEVYELLLREEKSLLKDMREIIRNQVQNKIAFIRQQAIRVRIHALLIDSYVAAYRRNKGFFNGGDKLADEIAENVDQFNVYKTILSHPNVSEYDLPNPEEYKEFFRINPMYEMKRVYDHCDWSGNCPVDKLSYAVGHELPRLLQQHQQEAGEVTEEMQESECGGKPESCLSHSQQKEQWVKAQWAKARMYSSKQQTKEAKAPLKWRKAQGDAAGDTSRKEKKTNSNRINNNHNILADAQHTEETEPKLPTHFEEDREETIRHRRTGGKHSSTKQAGKEKSRYKNPSVHSKNEKQQNQMPDCKYRKSCHKGETVGATTEVVKDKNKIGKLSEKATTQPNRLHAGLDLGAKKQQCKWRKSCYKTGIVPDISSMSSSTQTENLKPEETTVAQREVSIQEACKWRKSCYKTGKLQPLHQTQKHSKQQEEPPQSKPQPKHEPLKLSEYAMKIKCHYRKSCYKTGIVADIAGTEKRQSTTAEESREPAKPSCKFRKSCSTEEPQAVPAAEKPKVKKTQKEEEKIQKSEIPNKETKVAPNGDLTTKKHNCKWRKTCYVTGIVPDLSVAAAKDTSKETVQLPTSKPKTIAETCKWRKSCYKTEKQNRTEIAQERTEKVIPNEAKLDAKTEATGSKQKTYEDIQEKKVQIKAPATVKKEEVLKIKQQQTTEHTKKLPKQAKDKHPSGSPAQKSENAKINVAQKKDKVNCRWRKSCYKTGIPPDLTITISPQPQKEKTASETSDSRTLQEKCKWRKRCYQTGIVSIRSPEQTDSKPVFTDSQPAPASKVSDERPLNERCKWRKSCYETGKLPDLSAVKTETPTVVKEAETKKLTIQERCKWRKNCYEGVDRVVEQVAQPTVRQFVQEKAEPYSADKPVDKKQLCRWRKTCYETGAQPDFVAKPPSKTNDQQPQPCNKYRKSCTPAASSVSSSPTNANRKEADSVTPPALQSATQTKCNKYRKSCQQVTPETISQSENVRLAMKNGEMSQGIQNQSTKCNKWRLSCRESLGMPPKAPKRAANEQPKKLCRKKKPEDNSQQKTTKWRKNSTDHDTKSS